jgi:SAM-dependent methyltransferase
VLAKKGFSVKGVDRSQFLREKAKERAKSEGSSVEWVLEDMRRYIRPMSYDFALNMFTSFGYFDDKNDDMKVHKNVLTNSKSGGVFLIDIMRKERSAKILQPTIADAHYEGRLQIPPRISYNYIADLFSSCYFPTEYSITALKNRTAYESPPLIIYT